MALTRTSGRTGLVALLVGLGGSVVFLPACAGPAAEAPGARAETADASPETVIAEVEAAVRAFHRADTARDAEAVIDLLWPEYTMLGDGAPLGYTDVVDGSRQFMGSLALFHTVWTDLRVIPLGQDAAVSSFIFRDSIVTNDGELIQNRGPTTLVWQRRGGEWRVLFGDADHYPLESTLQ